MKAVELVAPQRLRVTARDLPQPGPCEVRIAVSHVGICGTDMEFYGGRRAAGYPFVLGHECSGRIDAVGRDMTDWEVGTLVTLRPNFGCGTCAFCLDGRDNICPSSRGLGVTIDGCLAEYIVVPARYVWRVPAGMDVETAALIEPVAVAERAVQRAGPLAGRSVLILGAGPIGLFALQIAKLAGAEVRVADPVASRRQWASNLGAVCAFDPTTDEMKSERFDVVIETAGVPETVSVAVDRARPGGRIVLTGIPMKAASVETRWVVWRELQMVGSFIYELADFARACDRVARGEIRALDLVTARFSVDRAAEAFEAEASRDGLKVLIKMREEEC